MEAARGAIQSFRSSPAFITFVIAYAVFTDQFLFAAIIPVYPYSLQERTGVPKEHVQVWVAILLGVFGIACLLISVPWGWFTDRTKSRRTPFTIGLFLLLGATLLLWFTTTLAGQIVGRALQGISSAVVWTTGMAVLVDAVGQRHIGEYMGYIGIALNAGSLVAPFLGGIIYAKCGYNAVYGLIVAIIVFDIILRATMVEQNIHITESATTADIMMITNVEAVKPNKTITIDQLSVFSQTTLVPHAPNKAPAILRLLCSTRFCVTLWGVMVNAAVFSGFQATLALFVHKTFGWDAVGGGLVFIPLSFPAVFGPVIGRFTDRYGGRWFAVAGFLLFGISLVLLRFVEKDTIEQKALLCVLLVMVGSCMALNLEPLFAEITFGATRLEKEDIEAGVSTDEGVGYYGSAYAWFNIAWASGNFIGPLMAGMVMDAAGWSPMTWALGLLGGISAIPIGLWCGGWYFAKREE